MYVVQVIFLSFVIITFQLLRESDAKFVVFFACDRKKIEFGASLVVSCLKGREGAYKDLGVFFASKLFVNSVLYSAAIFCF